VPYGISHGLGNEFAAWQAPTPDDVRAAAEKQMATAKMARLNTTLVVVATDAALTKPECKVVARVAQDGVARAVRPAHTLFDGDCIFTVATGARPLEFASTDAYASGPSRAALVNDIAAVAADTVARAIVRALLTATSVHGSLSYRDLYPSSVVPLRPERRPPSPLSETPP
jgi:L-aminopeptidase/D-esterase-like protein